jgi:uncharacterized OsmC-like protein
MTDLAKEKFMFLTKICLSITVASIALFQLVEGANQSKTSESNINGLNTKPLKDLADQLKKNPQAGKATFYTHTDWDTGMKSVTKITGYKIDGQMKKAKERVFTLVGDEMTEIAGTDTAPGAIEEMMYAVGTCIVAATNANAALQGVKLSKIQVALESDIDMHGLMGIEPKVRPGVLDFRTTITIAGNADDATLKKLAMKGFETSPVSDTVRKGSTRAAAPKIIIVK